MQLPSFYNYIGLFLTMRCNFKCSYCINWKQKWHYTEMIGDAWIRELSRLETDLPITLQGGEPSLHNDFYSIIQEVNKPFHLLTNLSFNIEKFIEELSPDMFDNSKTFPAIRVSYHGEFHNIVDLINKIEILYNNDFKIGLYIVNSKINNGIIKMLEEWNIDWLHFEIKPELPNEIKELKPRKWVECRTREFLLSPDGGVFRCHRDLYKGENRLSYLQDLKKINEKFIWCENVDECHPCDLKVKRDRFGNDGYSAVEIKKRGKQNMLLHGSGG